VEHKVRRKARLVDHGSPGVAWGTPDRQGSGQPRDEKSLNSVRATHSGQGITHRGFCSHVNLVCYIHTFSLSFFEPIFPGFWNLPSARSLSESRTRLPLANLQLSASEEFL
jgi:hypothetical protein